MSTPSLTRESPTTPAPVAEAVRQPAGEAPDGARAVAAARRAQPAWAAKPLAERLAVLRRARQLIPAHAATYTGLVHTDRRAPGETLGAEVLPLADAFRFLEQRAAAILRPRRLGGRFRPMWLSGVKAEVRREPYGVILIIGPSNYPLFLVGVQAIQALAAGNAALMKPGAGAGPVTRAFADMLVAAGLDRDLVPVLSEAPEAGAQAIQAGVDKVFLTGSARTGAAVLAQLAPRLTPATMELSGCDAVFVRGDADLDLVTRALRFGLHLNRSETCIAPRRVFVDQALAPELQQRLAAMAEGLQSYPSRTAAARWAARLITDAVERGGRLVAGQVLPNQEGITPAVVANASPDMPLLQEDAFAPVVAVVPVANDEEALRAAARCPYALGASVFSRDLGAARALAERVHAGGVTVNDVIAPTADPRLPFGGRDRSGFGVTRGEEGLLEVTTPKVISTRHGGLDWHLDSPHPADAAFFEAYIRATNCPSWRERMAAWFALIRVAIGRWRGGPAPQETM
jgi:acyl-CoA reductase-like NAD-dependent aldehyde dehydrogenase